MKKGTKHTVILSLLTSQALVLAIIESWLPIPAIVPGVKLGLANIITLLVIMLFGFYDAILVVIVRSALTSFFTGGFTMMLFSLTGGIFSTIIMYFLFKKGQKYFSIIGISIAGAIMHNVGQLVVASIFMQEIAVMSYIPLLLISAIFMGFFTGLSATFLEKLVRKSVSLV